MNLDFFKTIRILDGGMGQELFAKGMQPQGTLWSANALLQEKYHPLLLDIHLDFIKAGAEVIVTTTFTTRRKRLRENGLEDKFEYLNKKAGEIAQQAKAQHPHVLVAGGLPPQNNTYEADDRDEDEIRQDFYEQASFLNSYVDFFYFDVLSSGKEIKMAIEAIKPFNKPYLIGMHISQGTHLPSHEKITDIINAIDRSNLLGVILACVSPETYEQNLNEIKSLNVPFGFKFNTFLTTQPSGGYISNLSQSSGNPTDFLGKREDLTPKNMAKLAHRFKTHGATILGGCCQTDANHIHEMAKLK